MNIYYYFSVNDRFFTEATKQVLKITEGNIFFSGLANSQKDFLKNAPFRKISYLSHLNFKNVIADYSYLKKIEQQYKVSMAELFHMERHFDKLTVKDRFSYVQLAIKQIELDYEESPFDIIFSSGIADMCSYFLYCFAKEKNIPFYYYITNRLGSQIYLSNRSDTGPIDLEAKYADQIDNFNLNPESFIETQKEILNYVKIKTQPYYIKDPSMLFKILSINDINRFLGSVKKYNEGYKSFYASENPITFPFQRVKRITQKRRYDSYFKGRFLSIADLETKKYFVYPLHLHPEAATLIQGRWLHKQNVVVEMISRVLPADIILVVKEHKVSIGRRPLEFYKEFGKLHNVHFVSEKTEVYPLIEKSLGIVTISSSMGLEAIMLNKPVISFGDIHYNILSQVVKARDISKMKDYVDQALNFTGYNQNEYWAFFKTITENTFEMPGFSPHVFTEEHVKTFAEILKIVCKPKVDV